MGVGKTSLFVAVFAVALYLFLYPSTLFGTPQRAERSSYHCTPEELAVGELDIFPVNAIKRFSEKLNHPVWGYFFPRNSLDNWRHFVQHPDMYELDDSSEWPFLSYVDHLNSANTTIFSLPRYDRIGLLSILTNLNAQTLRILQLIPKFVFNTFTGFVLRIPTIQRGRLAKDFLIRNGGMRFGFVARKYDDHEPIDLAIEKAAAEGDCITETATRFEQFRLLLLSNHNRKALGHLHKLCFETCLPERKQAGWRCDSKTFNDTYTRELRKLMALTYMRMGEQENCQERHTHESCIAPLKGTGIHAKREGAEEAFKWYSLDLEMEPDSLGSKWLINLVAMQKGTYPDEVPPQHRVPPKAFESEYDIGYFPNIASYVGVNFFSGPGSVGADDFDNDGNIDIVQGGMIEHWCGDGRIELKRNLGNGTLLDVTTRAFGYPNMQTNGLNFVSADYNNDGLVDIFVLRAGFMSVANIPNSLLKNMGDFKFKDITVEAGLDTYQGTHAAVWADFDLDGNVDLWVSAEHNPCHLFRNKGDGTFEDFISFEMGQCGFAKGANWGDYNNDGWPDLYVSGYDQPNRLWKNLGRPNENGKSWAFVDVAPELGLAERPKASFPPVWFDFNNDGHLDLFVSSNLREGSAEIYPHYSGVKASNLYLWNLYNVTYEETGSRLFINNGDGTSFTDVSAETGAIRAFNVMGLGIGDLDNDGYLDLYAGTGNPGFRTLQPNYMMRNNAGKSFQDVTTSGGFGHLQKGHGISFADIDNDGDQDVLASMGSIYYGDRFFAAFFLNPGHGNSWMKIRLDGRRGSSNRAGIGARLHFVFLEEGKERHVHTIVSTGTSYGMNPLRHEVGLGKATILQSLTVVWPDRKRETQTFFDVPVNISIVVQQGNPVYTRQDIKSFKWDLEQLIDQNNQAEHHCQHHHHH